MTEGTAEDQRSAQIGDPEKTDLDERTKLALLLTDRYNLDPDSLDEAFFERLKQHFTVAEIIELVYRIMWMGGCHKVNAIFDIDPDPRDLDPDGDPLAARRDIFRFYAPLLGPEDIPAEFAEHVGPDKIPTHFGKK
jgi:hypothetical protein